MQMHAPRPPAGDALGEQRADAALVDLGACRRSRSPSARMGARSGGSIERAPKTWMFSGLERVQRPRPEERAERRLAGEKRQRHAVQVPARAGLGGVVVGVGVEPEHRHLAARVSARRRATPADRPHRDRMVAPEEDRHAGWPAMAKARSCTAAVQPATSSRLRQRAASRGCHRHRQGGGGVQRAEVAHPVAELAQRRGKGRRCGAPTGPMQSAGGGGAELELDAEERDVLPDQHRRPSHLNSSSCPASARPPCGGRRREPRVA